MAKKKSEKRKVGRCDPPQKKIIPKAEGRYLRREIFIVVLLLLVGLTFLSSFLPSSALTGKVVQTPEGYQLDLLLTDNVLNVRVDVSDPVPRSVNAISFNLTGTKSEGPFDICDHSSRSLLNWEFPLGECSSQQISYGVATLDPDKFKSGAVDVVEFTFPSLGYGHFEFILSNVKVWDTHSSEEVINLFASNDMLIQQFTREAPVAPAAVDTGTGGGPSGGSGGGTPASVSGSSIECIREWQCLDWTKCSNGQQRRSCRDLHQCAQNTSTRIGYKTYPVIPAGPQEPAELRSCSEQDMLLLAQAEVPQKSPPIAQPEAPQRQQPATVSLLQKYKKYVIAFFSALAVVILIVGITVIHHQRKLMYNTDELKAWMKQERATGTNDSDICDIVRGKTGWSKEEVARVFLEMDTAAKK